jgi:hypothetical protein
MTYEELGIRRAVLLGEPDPRVQTAMDAWQKAFESLGGQVLGRFEAEVEFPAEDMAQVKTLAPEAVILFPFRRLTPSQAAWQVLETGVEAVIAGVQSFSDWPIFLSVLVGHLTCVSPFLDYGASWSSHRAASIGA